jgi:DNA-3-methyladenine glycosylase
MARRLKRSFFGRAVLEVAPELVGATLLFNGVGGRIVELEAYHHTDPAAHSFRGPTERNAIMFGATGLRLCLSFLRDSLVPELRLRTKGSASAVLIRALEPTTGLGAMRRRRGMADERLLCSGPGRLCQALGITHRQNGFALDEPPFVLFARTDEVEVVTGPRIGITKAADKPWRYGLKGSRFLSKPFVSLRLSLKSKFGIEAQFAAGLFDHQGAVVLGNVVDARRAARHRKQRGVGRRINVERRLCRSFAAYQVPGP